MNLSRCRAMRQMTVSGLWVAVLWVSFQPSAHALESKIGATGFHQALSSNAFQPLLPKNSANGFALGGSFFSGRGSGVDPQPGHRISGLGVVGDNGDRFAELEGDQRIMALLIDGKYDFAYDFGTGLALHPYVGGGLGMALYEVDAGLSQGASMAPMFRVGGGVVYQLGADWDLSLNYKAGYTGGIGGNVFTGRSQETIDIQSLDMGLKFKF